MGSNFSTTVPVKNSCVVLSQRTDAIFQTGWGIPSAASTANPSDNSEVPPLTFSVLAPRQDLPRLAGGPQLFATHSGGLAIISFAFRGTIALMLVEVP